MSRFEPNDLSQTPLDELEQLLDDELGADVDRILATTGDQRFYVLALCVGERAGLTYLTGNTEEHLRSVAGDEDDPEDAYLRWDCSGDWLVIEPTTSLRRTNAHLSALRTAHDAWLWGLDGEERQRRAAETWDELDRRLEDLFQEAVRRLRTRSVARDERLDRCVFCLLFLDDPDLTMASAHRLNPPAVVARELGDDLSSPG